MTKRTHRAGCAEFNYSRSQWGRAGRRAFLRAGALSLLGMSLPDLIAGRKAAAQPSSRSFGQAKACILLFAWGGPAQMDTWDMKPDSPREYRGEFQPIETNVSGIQICEHWPRLARRTDQLAIVRSVTHGDVNHLTATYPLLSGAAAPEPGGPANMDWPHFGAALARLGRARRDLPPYVNLRPKTKLDVPRFVEQSRGQGAGWLGPSFAPFTIDTDPNSPEYQNAEFSLAPEISANRFQRRRALLEEVDRRRQALELHPSVQAHDISYERAFSLLTSSGAGAAFDLSQESDKLRDRYGRNPHGQSVLQARRLIEAGVPLVTVFWPNDGIKNVSVYWDTHNRNFIDLKERLMPVEDLAFSALLDDLKERGMLDETLILWTGEFGRTPKVGQGVVGGAGAGRDGRDHWPHCFSSVLAGGGIQGGQVYGKSDRFAAYPEEDPVLPSDIAATVYHCLGVDAETRLYDVQQRELRLCEGTPIAPLV